MSVLPSETRFCPKCLRQTQFCNYSYGTYGKTCRGDFCKYNGIDCYRCQQCDFNYCSNCCNQAKSASELQERIERQRREMAQQQRMQQLETERLERQRREAAERQRLQKLEEEKTAAAERMRLQTEQRLANTVKQMDQLSLELILERSRHEKTNRALSQLQNRLDAMESDSKQPQTEEQHLADVSNKPLPYIVMYWFITEYSEIPQYLPHFENDGMDSRILFDLSRETLINDLKIPSLRIRAILSAIDNLKKEWESLQSFLTQCKAVDLSAFATIAENKGLFGWRALAFVANDIQRLAQIFGVDHQSRPIQYLWNIIAKFKQTGQLPNKGPIEAEHEGIKTDPIEYYL